MKPHATYSNEIKQKLKDEINALAHSLTRERDKDRDELGSRQ